MQFFLPKVRKSHDQAQEPGIFILLRKLSYLENTLLEAYSTFLTALSKNCSPKTKKENTQIRKRWKKLVFIGPVLIWSKNAILKTVSKNRTNSFMLFRSRPEILKRFWFLYLKTVSSSNGRLVTWDAIFTTIPHYFQWGQEIFGWASDYNKATNYIFKKVAPNVRFTR